MRSVVSTLGDYTFWLKPEKSQKVKPNFSFGSAMAYSELLAQSKVQTEPRLRPNLI